MKKHLAVLAFSLSIIGCATSTHVKLPEDSVLKIQSGKQEPFKEGEVKRTPFFWSSASGIAYKVEKNGKVIREGKMSAKFRPVSIFWPPAAVIYWPIGFRYDCNDLTGETPVECSTSMK
jgi:hypothetical protein